MLIKLFATRAEETIASVVAPVLWWMGSSFTLMVPRAPPQNISRHPILAPVVGLLMGVGFLVVAAVCLLPVWIWFVR